MFLDVYDDGIGDDEPFELNHLETWQLTTDLFERQQKLGSGYDHGLPESPSRIDGLLDGFIDVVARHDAPRRECIEAIDVCFSGSVE